MLRNKAFKHFAILFVILSAVFITFGFVINTAAGFLVAAVSAVFGTAFFVYTKARYKSIAQISDQIDLVLHNEDCLDIEELDEGELSILHSEIQKMTLRIREQNDSLKKEKAYLADSLADIAHQLRTPLTAINLLLSLLANSTDANEQKAFVRETEALLVQMDWLITALLKISRLDAGVVAWKKVPIDIGHLMDTALRPIQIPIELHNIDIQINVPKGVVIQGDHEWLSEAIQNILKNCMESAGENGKIEIACTDNPLFTEMTIHDSGLGFKKEDLPHLFERFYRGKSPSTSGYGIGLALSKTIITSQGWTITAKNHPKGGAIFAIRFPK